MDLALSQENNIFWILLHLYRVLMCDNCKIVHDYFSNLHLITIYFIWIFSNLINLWIILKFYLIHNFFELIITIFVISGKYIN